MKRYLFILIILVLAIACQPTDTKPKWKLGVQTYTFHKFTLMEALSKSEALGLTYAEAYFGQTLGEGFADSLYLDYSLDTAIQKQILDRFAERKIQLYAMGVAFYTTAEEWTKFFQFAQQMGVKIVSCEPLLDQLDLVEQLATQYNIQVAIHNHPAPSIYADPAVLVEALKGRSEIMGVCADPGHWKRVGKDPVASLKLFENKLKIIHIKDLSEHLNDTVWGKGILQVDKLVTELKKQKFDGLLSVEFESFGAEQQQDIQSSLLYLDNLNK